MPHLVQCKGNGQYVCDSSCFQWKSAWICSHVVAVAELQGELVKFLQWYCKAGVQPNITTVAMEGLPAGHGRKGGRAKPKRQRLDTRDVLTDINCQARNFTTAGEVGHSTLAFPEQHLISPGIT